MSIKSSLKKNIDSFDDFSNWFLKSKDIALQPINFIFESECNLEIKKKNYLSLKSDKQLNEEKESSRSKKSKKSKKSQKSLNTQKSQKSTSNISKKHHKRKGRNSIYNSNVVIVHYDTNDDDCSSTDPIEREVEKLKKLISKNKIKKKKVSDKSNKTNITNITNELII